MKFILVCTVLAVVAPCLLFGQSGTPPCSQCAVWNAPQKPFRIFGNTYYVGPHGLSSILITSNTGHVLIDGGIPESAAVIESNIRTLGFRVQDVKLIVNSHVHFDHAGGIAALQHLSGAMVAASPWSAAVLRHGGVGKGDPQYGEVRPIAAVKNVQELHDGQNFRVGKEILITAHLTPGHTPGGTSWTWKSCEGDVCRQIVFADSLNPVSAKGFRFTHSDSYPTVLQDFDKSFAFLDVVPCEILITVHPENSRLWDRLGERERGATPDPFVDPTACQHLAEQSRASLRERLADEEKAVSAR
ncbi:MAG TPA: subclass B3 metallo-beta-lactamase [Candidatus Sulfotelmatobacter sp.]|nr:subclass B3 metallo-beta-lactamase [Candidatus Sulfotelmatobacter sp.]